MARPFEDAPALVLLDLCGEARRQARDLALSDGTITPAEAAYLDLLATMTAQAELVNESELNAVAMLRRGRLTSRRVRRMREIGADVDPEAA